MKRLGWQTWRHNYRGAEPITDLQERRMILPPRSGAAAITGDYAKVGAGTEQLALPSRSDGQCQAHLHGVGANLSIKVRDTNAYQTHSLAQRKD